MRKSDIMQYFDDRAHDWDANMIKDDAVINRILDNAEIGAGVHVLDVACGTGVLIPYLLERGVASVTAIDISSEMVKLAREKFSEDSVNILWGDVEETDFGRRFDRIIVYNAFPHFPKPAGLIERLSSLLEPNGILTVAHGMSRDRIDARHQGKAAKVSMGLMHEDELASLFARHTTVTVKVSDARMYQVAGRKHSRIHDYL